MTSRTLHRLGFAHPGSLRAALAPLGRRSAYSWPVAAVLLSITTAKQLISDAQVLGGPFATWVAASALSALAFLVIFGAIGALVRRAPEPSPFIVLAGYVVAGATRGISVGLAASSLGLADEPLPGFRIMAVTSNTLILAVAGYVVGRHDRHCAVLAEIDRDRQRAGEAERLAEVELDRSRAELAGAVRASLAPAVRALDDALADAAESGRASDALDRLERFVKDEVRPLSHRLATDPVAIGGDAGSPVDALTPRVALPARYRLADGIRPGLTTAAVGVLMLGTAARDLASLEAVGYIGFALGSLWASLAVVRRALGGRQMPTFAGVAFVAAGHAAIAGVILEAIALAGVPRPEAILPLGAFVVGVIGGLVSLGDVVESRRAITEDERASVVARLEEAVALATRRTRLVRIQLARVVHGSLQGELYAAVIRLRESPSPSPAVLTEVRAAVASALANLDNEVAVGGRTRATLDGIVAIWLGRRAITSRIEERADRLLAADPVADEAVAEVVREAVNNALRHGKARNISIEVALVPQPGRTADGLAAPAGGGLRVRVKDDGSGWAAETASGQGSALYDELCGQWRHASDEGGTTFSGIVSLS